jgi:hypothetical protein
MFIYKHKYYIYTVNIYQLNTKFSVRKPTENKCLGDLDINARIILKWI